MPTRTHRSPSGRHPAQTLRKRKLALGLATLFSVPAALVCPAAFAGEHLVSNCDDSGPGSLRDAVAAAVSGDVVQTSPELACSQITLTSGAIPIGPGADSQPITELTIQGPGRNALTVDGSYLDRVFVHEAGSEGVLSLGGMTLKHGFNSGDGGCVLAEGTVNLTDVGIEECRAGSGSGTGASRVRGGGVSAGSNINMMGSLIGANAVDGHAGYAYGAGLFAGGDVVMIAATVSGNFATSEGGGTFGGGVAIGDREGRVQGSLLSLSSSIENNGAMTQCTVCPVRGGGAWVYGNPTFQDSTVSGNGAFSGGGYGAGGGLYFNSRYGGSPVHATLTGTDLASNSADEDGGAIGADGDLGFERGTISGNSANGSGGAIVLLAGDLDLNDSLVTGNIAVQRGGGIFIFGYGDTSVHNSTISENIAVTNGGAIANTYGSVHLANATLTANSANAGGGGIWFRYGEYTLAMDSTIVAGNTAGSEADDIAGPGLSVDGANNLVVAAAGVALPGDTISADPMLEPLAQNGGPTMTHALSKGSPAIDAGSNPWGLAWDQRGENFARVSGSAADIGAFEWQSSEPDDRIFADGFDP